MLKLSPKVPRIRIGHYAKTTAALALWASVQPTAAWAQLSLAPAGTPTLFSSPAPAPTMSSTGPANAPQTAGSAAQQASGLGMDLTPTPYARPDSAHERTPLEHKPNAEADNKGGKGKKTAAPEELAPEPPSQFQLFVQQSTGRLLPIYGHELFTQPQAYQTDAAAPAPADYLISPGDEIAVKVWGSVGFEGTLTVDRNGQVTLPRMGVVTVAGVRADDVAQVLRAQIGQTFTQFEVSATMGRLRSLQVYIVGQARKPGSYNLPGLSTLANALFASGGPSAQGSMRHIQLKRRGKLLSTFDLYDFISRGDKAQDLPLQAGDVIVIPPAGPRVALTGALDQAAIYELPTGAAATVGDVLALRGGTPVLASTRKALIERIDPQKNPARQVHDLTLDAAGLSRPLRDGDIVTLLGISPAFANAVTLQGNVAAPLRYQWFQGMRIKDLIPEESALISADYYQRKNLLVQNVAQDQSKQAGNTLNTRVRTMVDQINWDYAVIERLDKTQLRTQLIPFHLGRAVLQGDASQNLELLPGDVVTIMSQKDLKLPEARQTRLVRIEGEVAAPGLYEALPGETLAQLIRRIGGVTPQAYMFGMVVERVSVRERQQENLDMLIRRLEGQQQSQILFLLANRSASDAAGSAALIEQQRHMAERQLQALRLLRSQGRITLELNPEQSTLDQLPQLALEDGDSIVIPSVPSFVSAVGAIHNENVFIYKAGRTVADVVKVAGLREEADADEMFVLRADGSIIGRSTTSFFGGLGGVRLMPGDTLVVPEKLDRESTRNFVMRQFKDVTQILSQFGLGVAAIKAIKNL